MEYINRALEGKIAKWFEHYPVIAVTGARQVGKSTLIENLFKKKISTVVFDPVQDVGNTENMSPVRPRCNPRSKQVSVHSLIEHPDPLRFDGYSFQDASPLLLSYGYHHG